MRELPDYQPVNRIEYLNRSHRSSGVIVFSRPNQKGELVPIGGCRPDELANHAELLTQLCEGAVYATSNGVWEGKRREENGLRFARRQKPDIRFIERVSVDLDVGREEEAPDEGTQWRQFLDGGTGRPATRITAEEAVEVALERCHEKNWPTPSAIVFSGQGAQLHWDIHDVQNPLQSPRDHSRNKRIHEAVGKALIEIFADLAADENAWDLARIFRVPGSINQKSGRRVKALYRVDENGHSPTYSLPELASAFGTKSAQKKTYGRARKDPARRCPNNKAGEIERAVKRARDIEKVEAARGGWKEGKRRNSLFQQALIYATIKMSAEGMKAQLEKSAAQCCPPFPSPGKNNDGTIEDIIAEVRGKKSFAKNPTLMELFEITPEMVTQLELETIMPEAMLEARDARLKEQKRATKKSTQREAIVAATIEANPTASINQVREVLAANGFTVSRSTADADLKKAKMKKENNPIYISSTPAALGALISVQKSDTPEAMFEPAPEKPETGAKVPEISASLFSVQKSDTPPTHETTPHLVTPIALVHAAQRFEMLFGDGNETRFDLLELARVCAQENRTPGRHEAEWFLKVESELSAQEMQNYLHCGNR